MKRTLGTLTILGTVAAVAAVGALPAGAGPDAKRKSCDPGSIGRLGSTYVTSLHVRHVSCGKGRRVTKAFHKCRKQNGGKNGHCNNQPVKGFTCHEGHRSGVPHVQYNASVHCKRGAVKRVNSTYTQNL